MLGRRKRVRVPRAVEPFSAPGVKVKGRAVGEVLFMFW